MLVVKVELWSAITGAKTELARMVIANDGEGTRTRGNYKVATVRGRNAAGLELAMYARKHTREGEVKNHDRLGLHVWNLVAKALAAMNYGKPAA